MMHYSLHPKDQVFIKDYDFLSFAKNMGKSIGKGMIKNVSDKYSLKVLAEKSPADAFKTALKRTIKNGRSSWLFDR